jgi:hypothetical protein
MTPIDTPTLEEIAREHVDYEVRVLIDQVTHPALSGDDDVLRRSLIEGALDHVRVLDDFFRLEAARNPLRCRSCGSPLVCKVCENPHLPPPDDITAQHYLPSWSSRSLLSAKERGNINAQLSHLAKRRKANHRWDLGSMTVRACELFVGFVDQVRASDPGRSEWFEIAYRRAVAVSSVRRTHFGLKAMSTTASSSTDVVQRTVRRRQ